MKLSNSRTITINAEWSKNLTSSRLNCDLYDGETHIVVEDLQSIKSLEIKNAHSVTFNLKTKVGSTLTHLRLEECQRVLHVADSRSLSVVHFRSIGCTFDNWDSTLRWCETLTMQETELDSFTKMPTGLKRLQLQGVYTEEIFDALPELVFVQLLEVRCKPIENLKLKRIHQAIVIRDSNIRRVSGLEESKVVTFVYPSLYTNQEWLTFYRERHPTWFRA